jgi:hypothetical protein
MNADFDFDVALSFAGEDRAYVDRVANALRDQGVKPFYDLFEEADLWGKDLYTHLTDVYQKKARFTVMFISDAYGKKLWTNHERRAAQARAFQESHEYILPARFDETEIPGVLPTVGYISLSGRSPEDFASIVTRKLVISGGTVPTDLVRADFSTASLALTGDPTQLVVQVCDDEGTPIEGVSAALQADNGTTLTGISDKDGRCSIEVKTRRTFRLLIAHPAFPAAIIDKVNPSDSARVALARTKNVGSGIIHDTGLVPGLKGRLNPILDASNRTYLYADNIAIDDGKAQPATFAINQPMKLEDADGTIVYLTIKHISARVTLVQFTRRPGNV